MCAECLIEWDIDPATFVPTDELRRVGEMVRDFYAMDADCCTGGPLHIVVDDANVEDDYIDYCLGEFRESEYGRSYSSEVWAAADELGAALRAMSERDRAATVLLYDRW